MTWKTFEKQKIVTVSCTDDVSEEDFAEIIERIKRFGPVCEKSRNECEIMTEAHEEEVRGELNELGFGQFATIRTVPWSSRRWTP